jgi:hypothetical protein
MLLNMVMSKRKQKTQIKRVDRELRLEALLREGFIGSFTDIPEDAWPASIEVARQGAYTKVLYYRDKPFVCKDCGRESIWKKEDQRYWFEIRRETIYSNAVRCHECRARQRAIKEGQQSRSRKPSR